MILDKTAQCPWRGPSAISRSSGSCPPCAQKGIRVPSPVVPPAYQVLASANQSDDIK
jgi:hypothetical protein